MSFSDLTLLWDLTENKEVTFIENPSHFASHDSFVLTGVTPHMHVFNKDMKNARFVQGNEALNLFVQPARSIRNSSSLFRCYSELDLRDVFHMKRCEREDLHVKKIDYETMLASFNGLTFFEVFSSNSNYMELIMEQIKNDELNSKKTIDKSGNESDNIIIRRMFWTILLPVVNQSHDPIFERLKKKNLKLLGHKNILQEKLFD